MFKVPPSVTFTVTYGGLIDPLVTAYLLVNGVTWCIYNPDIFWQGAPKVVTDKQAYRQLSDLTSMEFLALFDHVHKRGDAPEELLLEIERFAI